MNDSPHELHISKVLRKTNSCIEQLFGTVITRVPASTRQESSRPRNKSANNSRLFVPAENPYDSTIERLPIMGRITETSTILASYTTDAKMEINLELMLRLEQLYTEIMRLMQKQQFGIMFNKCTEWWDTSVSASFNVQEVI